MPLSYKVEFCLVSFTLIPSSGTNKNPVTKINIPDIINIIFKGIYAIMTEPSSVPNGTETLHKVLTSAITLPILSLGISVW